MLLRDSFIRVIRDLCSISTESMHRNRKRIFGTHIGRVLRLEWAWHGTSGATAKRRCALLMGLRTTNTSPTTVWVHRARRRPGDRSFVLSLPPAAWPIHGPAFPAAIHSRSNW